MILFAHPTRRFSTPYGFSRFTCVQTHVAETAAQNWGMMHRALVSVGKMVLCWFIWFKWLRFLRWKPSASLRAKDRKHTLFFSNFLPNAGFTQYHTGSLSFSHRSLDKSHALGFLTRFDSRPIHPLPDALRVFFSLSFFAFFFLRWDSWVPKSGENVCHVDRINQFIVRPRRSRQTWRWARTEFGASSSGVDLPRASHNGNKIEPEDQVPRTCFMRLRAEPALNHSICCWLICYNKGVCFDLSLGR
jgi:hypothetical protein